MKNTKTLNPKLIKKPKLEVFGRLTEKYVPSQDPDLEQAYDENDIMHFQAGLLFCITHDN